VANALALLLGKAAENKPTVVARKGPPEDLIKAVADFRSAPTDSEAADALMLAVQLASECGNSDLVDDGPAPAVGE
jgi:hypothetical protein